MTMQFLGASAVSATGAPLIAGTTGSRQMEEIRIGTGTPFDEKWLQRLIFDHPGSLPIADIEPGFGELIPIALEIPCNQGRIDNLYLTPRGDIVVVETKLWGNPEARRKVVAQALDYAAALSDMTYGEFEAAILAGQTRIAKPASLAALVADWPDALPEQQLIDAVSYNLRNGRMLVMAVGDGIRREAQLLGDLLQRHAGAHFTFALVELRTFRVSGSDEVMVVPATLLRTVLVERGVVRIDDRRAVVEPVQPPKAAGSAARGQTLTEQAFYDRLAERDPTMPAALQAFIAELAPYGVYVEMGRSLNLKLEVDGRAKPVSLGYIEPSGLLWTNSVGKTAPVAAAERYAGQLALLIDGQVGYEGSDRLPHVTTNGKSAPRISQLLPTYADHWREAIAQLAMAVSEG